MSQKSRAKQTDRNRRDLTGQAIGGTLRALGEYHQPKEGRGAWVRKGDWTGKRITDARGNKYLVMPAGNMVRL